MIVQHSGWKNTELLLTWVDFDLKEKKKYTQHYKILISLDKRVSEMNAIILLQEWMG